jgi:hypothetical protein
MDVELRRFQIFIDNLKMVDSRNAAELAAGGNKSYSTEMTLYRYRSDYIKNL